MESPRHPAGQSPAVAHRPAGGVPRIERFPDRPPRRMPHGRGGAPPFFGRSFRLLVHPLHSGDTHPRAAQAHREDEVRPVGHQPRLPDPVRLRCLQRQRAAARAGLRAARSHSRRGEPLHAPLASLRSASGQRLPVAGIAATGHRILRPAPLRGVSGGSPPAGSAQTVRPRRRIPQPTLAL